MGATADKTGTFTIAKDGIICITTTLSVTDFSSVALYNFDYQGNEYFVGDLIVEIPKLVIGKAQISNINNSIIVVDVTGRGDYTNIQDAIDVSNDSADNPVTILVMPGTYPKFSMVNNGETVRYINLIGLSPDLCIVKEDGGNYYEPAGEINTNGVTENITFITTHNSAETSVIKKDAYAVHLDYGGEKTERFANCKFISYCSAGVGIGMHKNEVIRFDNCRFECSANDAVWGTKGLGALFFHNNKKIMKTLN